MKVGVICEPQPLRKKVKVKVEETEHTTVVPPLGSMFSASDALMTVTHATAALQYDADGYIIETIKKKYTIKDLPIPSNDSRWSRGLVGTITLWAGAQPNVWVIPEESLVAAVQVVWDVVFPRVKYRVTADGSVIAIVSSTFNVWTQRMLTTYSQVQQRLAEWRSGIGSTTICIMIDFFSKLDDNVDVPAMAAKLFKDFAFLCEDPDQPCFEGMFQSSFLIELLGTTHLNDIMGYVDIHEWNTKDFAAGKDMAGVLGMACAAVSLYTSVPFHVIDLRCFESWSALSSTSWREPLILTMFLLLWWRLVIARSDSSSLKSSIKRPGRTRPHLSNFRGQTGALTHWHTGTRLPNEVPLGFRTWLRLPNVPASLMSQQVTVLSPMMPWRL